MTVDAQKLLSAVVRTGERFGAGHIVDIVKGANTEKIRQWGHDGLPTHGVGADKPKKHWSALVSDLLNTGALRQDDGRFPTLQLTDEGREILYGRKPFMVVLRVQKPQAKKPQAVLVKKSAGRQSAGPAGAMGGSPGRARDGVDPDTLTGGELFELLRKKRLELSREKKIAPYMVFSDASLEEMAERLPTTRSEFLSVSGVGRKKMRKYGDIFLGVIREYLGE
jgi:ATP-dependent DNA helicase RecQ